MNLNKIHWVGLDEEKPAPHFEPLNETTEKKESKLKPHVLANSLWDVVHRFNNRKIVSESVDGSEMQDVGDFFQTSSWEDFKHHAEIMGNFLQIDKESLTNAINEFEQQLRILGGEEDENGKTSVERGFDRVNEVQTVLQQSGIARNGDNGGVIPEITVRHFLDLLNPIYKVKGTNGKLEERKVDSYDVGKFIDMILTRKNRLLTKVIDKDGTIRQVLANLFKTFGKEGERIFRKIVSAGNYQKNGAAVGKTELALALFFSDCKLPDKQGDIQLTVKDGVNKAIEIKGSAAVITNRITRSNRFDIKMNDIATTWLNYEKPFNVINKNAAIIKDLNLNEIDPKNKKGLGEALNKKIILIDEKLAKKYKNVPMEQWNALKFVMLFGGLFRSYAQGVPNKKGETKGGFDEMWIFNTEDDLGNNKRSALLDSRIVKVHANKNMDWYEDGKNILKSLKTQKIDVQFQSAHDSGQGGFKAIFF